MKLAQSLSQSRVHFIGIGGIGMCGLAELLHNMGAQVSGSDLQANAQSSRLKVMGVSVEIGHRAENLKDVDVVVYSSAIKAENPELVEARRRRIPMIPRAEALAEIMRLKRGVAVGGTHGKTTTTSLAAAIFLEAQSDPTIVIGGRLDLIKSTALLGKGEWIVAEADESDGSFHRLSPEIAIITNIDNDHLDHYGNFLTLQKAFFDFALRIPFYGSAVLCGDDPKIRSVFAEFPKRSLFYGFAPENDYVLKGSNCVYEVWHLGQNLGGFHLHIPGKHNALNALAAIVAGIQAGLDFSVCARGVERFRGVDRRLQLKGIVKGIDVIDDYGHHPTEMKAVFSALREKYPSRRVIAYFQPHRYSRTQLCWAEFVSAFKDVDEAFVFDIYAAGELPVEGITSQKLVEAVDQEKVKYAGALSSSSIESLAKNLRTGDVIVTLGAGDIWKSSDWILKSLESH